MKKVKGFLDKLQPNPRREILDIKTNNRTEFSKMGKIRNENKKIKRKKTKIPAATLTKNRASKKMDKKMMN